MPVDLFHLSAQLFNAYLLVTLRVFGLFTSIPLFGERSVPWQTRAGLSMLVGWLLLPLAHGPSLPDLSVIAFGLAAGCEFAVGVAIGFLARLMVGAFQFAVQAIDYQTGLSFVELVNPSTDSSLSVLGQFLNTLMLLLFLELNGHHLLLSALGHSLEMIPLGGATPAPQVLVGLITMFSEFVAIALQLALPTVMVLLLIDVAMGIIGRVFPQMNVFLAAVPVKILVGLGTLWLTLPALAALLGRLLQILGDSSLALLKLVH
ncbi:MAG: flagellar biosynthetic protein FliR [Armatimonadetes bacterium]|nr:flagellar biosynthetic protein FliR [Armatimonadota bacterium]